MRLTKAEVEAIFKYGEEHYLPLYTAAQKRWYYHNKGHIKGIMVANTDFETSSQCSNIKEGAGSIKFTPASRSNISGRFWVIFHEYGHEIFDAIHASEKFSHILSEEITQLNEQRVRFGGGLVVTDAYSIVHQKYMGTHPAGYGEDNPAWWAATETFSSYLAYVLTGDAPNLSNFERFCPKTTRILNKIVNSLWK